MSAPLLPDHAQRREFCEQIDRNFSVIAPAGVGKTTAIVERIVQIARHDLLHGTDRLRRLVVVTYTNKAARHMLERAQHALRQEEYSRQLLQNLRHGFFGTIHSFCMNLLRQEGSVLGITPEMNLLTNPEADWMRFLSQCPYLEASVDETIPEVLRYVGVDDILKLAQELKQSIALPIHAPKPPRLDLHPLLSFVPTAKNSVENVAHAQALARAWLEREKENSPFNPIPVCSRGGQAFLELWRDSFAPLADWIEAASTHLAAQVGQRYLAHRIASARLTYHDQIELAAQLLAHPESGQRLRQANYLIILDEAQDTDPDQFQVLLELARPASAAASTDWLEGSAPFLRPGAFCMVGDPQQLIYSSRADLGFYKHVRKHLVASGGKEINFRVTFRCAQAIIERVNSWGPTLLDGQNNQCLYVSLEPRPNATHGQCLHWKFTPPPDAPPLRWNQDFFAYYEAQALATQIRTHGLQGLQACNWNEVALLAPRRQWLEPLAEALEEQGLRVQLHSNRKTWGERPFYRWLLAAMTIIEQPFNSYEIVGVLREIFGLSDETLADFARQEGAAFQVAEPSLIQDTVGQTLDFLTTLRNEILVLPLREAVEAIVNRLHIIERLHHIGELKTVPEEWESILIQSNRAEARGRCWSEFSEALRDQGSTQEPEVEALPDHLQLLTHHKAKGLEWDAVILPFLYRPMIERSDSYPQIVRQVCGQIPHIMMESSTRVRRQEELELRGLQERQRLLYVALTRARNTLALIDDLELFAIKTAHVKKTSATQGASPRSFGYLVPPLL